MSGTSEIQIQDLLSQITDAVLVGNGNMQALLQQSGVPRNEVAEFIETIEQLQDRLIPIAPSKQFSNRLRHELMGTSPDRVVIKQVKQIPMRVRMAAVLAFLAGSVMWLARRRNWLGDSPAQEEAAAV